MTKAEFDAKKNRIGKISELCDLQAEYIESLEQKNNYLKRIICTAEAYPLQDLTIKLNDLISAPAVATHEEVIEKIKKKFVFDKLSDKEMPKKSYTSKDIDDGIKALLSSMECQVDPLYVINHAKTALSFIQFLRDVLGHLTLTPADLEKIQFDLDDNYDVLETKYNLLMESDFKSIIDQLMTQMVKLQIEISDKIIDIKHIYQTK